MIMELVKDGISVKIIKRDDCFDVIMNGVHTCQTIEEAIERFNLEAGTLYDN